MKFFRALAVCVAMVISIQANAQAGLIFGFLLGKSISNGKTMPQVLREQGISGIPLRCLYVTSDEDYYNCRWTSMMAELSTALSNVTDQRVSLCAALWTTAWRSSLKKEVEGHEKACDVNWHISLELNALKKLNHDLEK